ncbi:MAG TPA: cell division protein FtsA [Bdellovibrionales bacterium]|nr:cell division protein FtsA [Bdellovibrionales bacterium]
MTKVASTKVSTNNHKHGSATGRKPQLIAGLDIGSSKVSIVIGTPKVDAQAIGSGAHDIGIDIVGLGTATNTGIRQGVVVNVEATIEAITKAREEAELMSGYQIDEVYVAVGGAHVKSFDSRGMVAIRNKEVKTDDIDRVIEAAKAVAVPADREVLHVLPREFKIDEQTGIFDPIGMSGVRLEANVHIVTAGQTALQNIIKCTEKAGLKVKGLVLQQLATALAVLSEDEMKLGAAVVDMGGGTSDIITYVAGSVAFTATVPVGGQHFTQDIAMGLRTPQSAAEAVKRLHGCAIADLVDENETIEVEGVGGRKPRALLRRDLCEVIEPRAEETMSLIWQEIRKSGLAAQIGSGLVLAGGACQMEGLLEMGEFISDIPVRKGLPERIGGLTDIVRTPECATVVGLLKFGLDNMTAADKNRLLSQSNDGAPMADVMSDLVKKVRDFFSGALN